LDTTTFDAHYETGVLWQDLQHKELIDRFNILSDQNFKTINPKLFTSTTGFLVMYSHHHLTLEEAYMEKYEYPDTEFHKKAHKEFIKMLKDFRKNHNSFSQNAVDKLLADIKEWILGHILENDKKLGWYIRETEKKILLRKTTN